MGDDAQIDDELYDRIYECMLQRLRDVFPIVRVHAVFALARLQDPTDVDCPIINGEPAFPKNGNNQILANLCKLPCIE